MKFRRVLVLVMAVVMMVSAMAPSISAAFKPETKHEHFDDVLNDPELKEKYEEIKATVEYVAKDIEENHEEYYANGYAYALENGYIGTAIEVIGVMLEILPQIDLDGVEMTEEFREDLEAELEALEPTLEKLLGILESGEASDFDGFVNAALTLEGDLYLHMNNIYAILEQASIDLNQFILVPAFYEALRILEEEVLPAVEEAVNAFVDGVVDYVIEALTPYYEKAVEVIGIARDTYELLVETIVKINLYVENTIDAVVNTYNALVAKLVEFYGNVQNAIRVAAKIYNNVIDTIVEINAKVEGVIDNIESIIIATVNAYKYTIQLIVNVYGTVENAVIVAGQVYNYVVNLVIESKELLEEGLENASELVEKIYADIVEILENAPTEVNAFVNYVATQLTAYIVGILNDLDAFILNQHNGVINGNYELKDDSLYVALGNSPYGEALAEKLNLSEKYFQFGVQDDYLDKVAGADLVTIKVDGNEFVDFANKQVSGTIAGLIRNNEKLMSLYNHPFIGAYVRNVVAELGIDAEAQTEELDWNRYLDADDQEMLRNALAIVKAELISRGIPEYYYIDLQPLVQKALEENGLAGLPGISIVVEPIEVPVADIAVYAVESALYAYARFTNDLGVLLSNIYATAPNATVVLVGINNPLEGFYVDFGAYGVDCINYEDCLAASGVMVQTFNAQLYLAAFKNDNTVFVFENDADAIYNALNVYCDHVYDNCLDEDCNRCLAVRVAPGHSFTIYTVQTKPTCTKEGTEVAVCDHCDATDSRSVAKISHDWKDATCTAKQTCKVCGATQGSTKPHDWEKATCTEPRTCKVCGKTDGKASGHKYGVWEVIEEATRRQDGSKERVCRVCGHVETEVIPMILPKYPASTIILVIVSAVVTAAGISTLILWRLRKRDILK